jgi:TP901 family phage tail tape measure protein
MTTRTVAVVLSGTVTPYQAAMRAASRTTVTTAATITTAMRTATTRASGDLTRMAARGSATMAVLRGAASVTATAIATRFTIATTRAATTITALGRAASATWATITSGATRAAGWVATRWSAAAATVSARWPVAAARISSALTTAAAAGARAAAVTALRWSAARTAMAAGWSVVAGAASAAATAVGTRWSAASAVVTAGVTAARTAAGSAASWIAARWAAAAGVVGSRWTAASAVVVGAATATRTAAGAAATWVARRWSAAGAAMSSAMLSLSAAAAGAGAVAVTTANGAQKSLKAARMASLGLLAAFGLAAYAAANFDKAMSGVKAVTFASGRELSKLRQAAIDAGQATQYSATQAANAEAELAKAGVSTADILGGGLRGTLSLAAAGQLDLADAAVVAAKAMNAFGLSGDQVGHVADVLAAGAGKSATDVHQLGMALAQSALLAHQTGLSLEDTAGALSLFAQNGLAGSDAGTSLKTMLMRLTPQSQEARDMMDKLGFSAYNSSGQFIGLSATAGQMQKAFGNMTPEARNAAFGVIFGSDATRAASVIYSAGAAGIDKWTAAVNDQGYASRVAATQTDNLTGDLERLKGALETALIQSGTAANGVLRDMAQKLTGVVNWYGKLSPSVQRSVTMMAGVVGVVGLIATSLLLMLPRVIAVRNELRTLGLTAARTRTLVSGMARMGLVVGVLTAMTMAADKLTTAMKKPAPNISELTNSLVDLADSGKGTADSVKQLDGFGDAVARIAHPSTLSRLTDVASSVGHLGLTGSKVGSLTEATDQLKGYDEALANLVSSGSPDVAAKAFKKMGVEAEKSGTSTEKLKGMLPKYANALADTDTQQKLAAASQGKLGDEAAQTADDLQDTATQAEKLTTALDTLNGKNIDVAESEISFRQALADMRDTVKKSGHSLDITTDAGRKVKESILGAAKAAIDHAKAVGDQTGSMEAGQAAYAKDIAALKEQLKQRGFETKQINDLIHAYAQVPATVATEVKTVDSASKELASIQDRLAKTKSKDITVKALTAGAEKDLTSLGFKVTHMKNGTVRIYIPTGAQAKALDALKRKVDAFRDRTVVLTIRQQVTSGAMTSQGAKNALDTRADGGIVGMPHAAGGMFIPGYEPRVDSVHVLASKGEGILVPEAVRKLGMLSGLGSAGVIKRLNAWGRYGSAIGFANGGVVGGTQRFASGGIATYAPSASPTLGGTSDAMDRYNAAVAALKASWSVLGAALKNQATQVKQLSAAQAKASQVHKDGVRKVSQAEANLDRVRSKKHTAAQLAAAEDRLTNARAAAAKANAAAAKSVAKERSDVRRSGELVDKAKRGVNASDAALGVARGAKAPAGFDLKAYQIQLTKSVAATSAWRASLAKIAGRGGQELESVLEGMGEDGYALVQALAKANDKQFQDISNKLLKQAGLAKASLADFNDQVNASTKVNSQFAADLQKLAGEGYGDLAKTLAAQGDAAAQALAHEAAGSTSKAAAANSTVDKAGAVLTGDDLANSLVLLSTLRGGTGRGYAELLAAGLTTATIQALVPRMMGQLNALPPEYKTTFLAQWAQQGGVAAMARGDILTRPTAVVAAEAGDVESWIPWNNSARSAGLLARTAAGMGYSLVPAGRFGGGPRPNVAAGSAPHHTEVHLHGAKQTAGEQAADIARIISFVG